MPCLHAEGLQDALTKCHTSSRNFKSGKCAVGCVEHAYILAQITVVTISRMLR
jgi:hypothetical protein